MSENMPEAEIERLIAIIRRALKELDVPAYYGPGSIWNDMIDAVADYDEQGGSNGGE
jgi:hypothetical protein